MHVSVAETVLVYVVAPLGVIAVLVLLNMRGARRRPRYRPGQPWSYPDVWFEPHPLHPEAEHGPGHGDGHAQLEAPHGPRAALEQGAKSPEPARVPGGPLGGARGTW